MPGRLYEALLYGAEREREMSARRRNERAGRTTRAPPAQWNGTSTSTVPVICTSAVLVVLPLDEEERDDNEAAFEHEQRADDDEAGDEPPVDAGRRSREACTLGPVTSYVRI